MGHNAATLKCASELLKENITKYLLHCVLHCVVISESGFVHKWQSIDALNITLMALEKFPH